MLPPPSLKKYWTRRGIAEWLVERLAEDIPTLVGINHGFSFPLRYFEVHGQLLASQFDSRAYRVPISSKKELGMFAKNAVKPLKMLVPLR